jgi:hypothetical protein
MSCAVAIALVGCVAHAVCGIRDTQVWRIETTVGRADVLATVLLGAQRGTVAIADLVNIAHAVDLARHADLVGITDTVDADRGSLAHSSSFDLAVTATEQGGVLFTKS